ncbi:MAG: peptidylprolyl isomerase [Ruminococcus sp.]|nr:peptidylprolyl isomerase [Ruminococcus sp.]
MIKKISALLLALSLCTGLLAGCAEDKKTQEQEKNSAADTTGAQDSESGNGGDTTGSEEQEVPQYTVPEPYLTIDGKAVDTADMVICTVEGYDVKFDEFRFYYYYTLDSYTTNWGITADSLKDDPERFEQFKEDVILCIKQEMVARKLAEENGLELSDEDLASIESKYQAAKANYDSEQAYLDDLKNAYMTDELYRTMLERAQTYTNVMTTLFANDGVYATKKEDFLKLIQDSEEYSHEFHVMIPFYSQVEVTTDDSQDYDSMTIYQKTSLKQDAYYQLDDDGKAKAREDAKAAAEEVLKKASEGEDISKLIEEYGWDIMEDPAYGYYIDKDNTGGYPDELFTEAFALQPGEISSEPVENATYGFFIVKREEPDMDYVNEHIEEMINSHDQPTIQDIFTKTVESIKVTYCDQWDKIDAYSIT